MGIRFYLINYLEETDLKNKVVVDIPAGEGKTSEFLFEKGAKVFAFDLFPESFKSQKLNCQRADLNEKLSIDDNFCDYIICQEGIEHIIDQLKVLKEFYRILKPEGKLIITTPSYSHLRARFCYFLLESEMWHFLPKNELDSVWGIEEGDKNEIYFGHIFLLGVQKLRLLGKLAGFKIGKIIRNKWSVSSVVLGIIFLPFILFFNLYAYFYSLKKIRTSEEGNRRDVFREILKLNLNPDILFGKHLFIQFEKNKKLKILERQLK